MSQDQPNVALAPMDRAKAVVRSTPKEQLLADISAQIAPTFQHYVNCAKTSFAVLSSAFNLVDTPDLIIATMYSYPGIAGRGDTCGGVTGSLAAINLTFERQCMPPSVEFYKRFEQVNGSTLCGDILEAGMGRSYMFPEDFPAYKEDEGFRVCLPAVTNAICIAAEIIYDALASE